VFQTGPALRQLSQHGAVAETLHNLAVPSQKACCFEEEEEEEEEEKKNFFSVHCLLALQVCTLVWVRALGP
jgi:hypothetical protein